MRAIISVDTRTVLAAAAAFILATTAVQAQIAPSAAGAGTPNSAASPQAVNTANTQAAAATQPAAKRKVSANTVVAANTPVANSPTAANTLVAANAPAPVAANTPAPEAANASELAALEEVTITGSRVIANGNDSPTPLTVVSAQQLEATQPGTIYQALNNLPELNNSLGQYSPPGGGTQAVAANTPNLRNLNFNNIPRTLVLWDGQRLAPTSPQYLSVDESMIPQMLIQRVDVVTGGVSAVYGSDAVAGVINYITDTKFNGVKVNGQAGIAQQSGLDKTSDWGIAAGTNFADGRGHIEGSLEFLFDPGVLYGKLDYKWAQALWATEATTANGPFQLFSNVRTNQYTFGGLIQGAKSATNPGGGMEFVAGGALQPFVHGTPTLNANFEQGGDGAYQPTASLKSALDSQQVFGRADYDFTDNLQGFAQFSGTKNQNKYFQGLNTFNETYSATNAFLTPAEQAALGGAGKFFKMQEEPINFPPTTSEAHETQYRFLIGLNGALGSGYKWQLDGSQAETQQLSIVPFNANSQHLSAALDAVVNPANGQIVCAAALTNPSVYSNCAPMDLFGPSAASQASINYVFQPTWYQARITMDDASGSFSGAPLNSWAGPIEMAVSGEYRNTRLRVFSDDLPTQLPNCTTFVAGTAGATNCAAQSVLFLQGNQAVFPYVSQNVKEAAYEVDAPLLKDLPFAKALSFNGAARFTDYSTSGSAWTWKLGLDWHINDQLTLRGTRSRDIRAPNLAELYAPPGIGLETAVDVLTNTNAIQVPRRGIPNPNLVPEVANTKTAGFVYQPDWLPHFSLAVDGYNIQIDNAIVQLQGDTATVMDACIASGGSSPYCALTPRPFGCCSNTTAANTATSFIIQSINIGFVKTYGADFEANYSNTVFSRPISARVLGTYQPHLIEITPGGIASIDLGGVQPTPAIRLTALINYSPIENFTVSITEKYRGSLGWNSNPLIIYNLPRIAPTEYTALNLAYVLKTSSSSQLEVFFNVQNLFNQWPIVANNGAALGDDLLGRYFTLGFHFRMQ